MKNKCVKISFCRVCKKENLKKVFGLGPTPLANEFLTKKQLDFPEEFYPLDVYFCTSCTMLQLGHVVDPKILFGNYLYVSSTSPVFVKHFQEFAKEVIARFSLNSKSLIVDIGSNDGILLKPYKDQKIPVLGIEPATHIAKLARAQGIDTIDTYFTVTLAKNIVKKRKRADVVTATNVFAHIHDLDEVILGIKNLITDDGIFILEAPYLVDFIEKRYFDLVYHEHLSYWSVRSLRELFKKFDMEIFDVQKTNVHGGSIRVFVKRKKGRFPIEKTVSKFLDAEKSKRLDDISTYVEYGKKILENRINLIKLLTNLKLKNKKIVGFGAPAKGNTLLNFFKIGSELLDYIVDDSVYKQKLFTPGTHIPVVDASYIKSQKPDYILLLAWNFAEPIMQKYSWFKKNGGKFIVPVPNPTIL